MKRTSGLRRWSAALVVAVSVLALSACTNSRSESNAPPEVRIGLLGTLTGPTAGVGQEAARGAELAALVVNQNRSVPVPLAGSGLPRLGGAKLRIVQADTADTKVDSLRAVTEATKLTTRGVAGIVSADSATNTARASERTERIGVPFIGAVATADFLTGRGLDWFFRATPTDGMLAQAGLGWLDQRGATPARRLGVLYASDDASNVALTALQGQAAHAGDEVPPPATFAPRSNAGQVRPSLDKARGGNPDAIIAVAAQQGDARSVLSADAADGGAGRPVTLAMGAGFTAQVIRQATQTTGTDLAHTAAWSQDFAERNLAANAVAQLYQQRYKTPMTEAAAETFTATLMLAQAIDAAGSVGAQQVRTALLGLDVPGRDTIMPWGGIRFDQTGENTLAAGLVEQVTQSSARVVFPRELAAANT
jgi:branched-chain amino acid transport system substrate-binding protein